MRYNVSFNQFELMKYNERHPLKPIDFKDAIILQQLWNLSTWKGVDVISLEDGEYFWAAYGKIISEIPAIGFRTKDGLSKRIKARLIENDLLRLFVNRDDNSKTYWQLTEKGLKIATPSRMDVTPQPNGREGVGRMAGRGSDGWPTNNNTNDNNTNDKREGRSHFSFFKENYKEDYTTWKRENEKKVYSQSEFIKAFDNKMKRESFQLNNKLINRLDDFTRHWIKNQKVNEAPEPPRPYLKQVL